MGSIGSQFDTLGSDKSFIWGHIPSPKQVFSWSPPTLGFPPYSVEHRESRPSSIYGAMNVMWVIWQQVMSQPFGHHSPPHITCAMNL
eukprot:3396475-Pyramimonas_sp.AAC.2